MGAYDAAVALLKLHASLDVMTYHKGYTALHDACKEGRLNCASLLLSDPRVNVNASHTADHGDAPLHVACKNGRFLIAQLLLSHGADALRRNRRNKDPMFYATKNRHSDIAQLLAPFQQQQQ